MPGPFDMKVLRDRLHHSIAHTLQRWAVFVARNPLKVLPTSLLVLIIMCAGLTQLVQENRAGYLWSPTNEKAYQAWEYVKNTFGEDGHVMALYARVPGGGNILTEEPLLELLKAHEWTTEECETEPINGKAYKWEDVCHKYPEDDDCASENFLDIWNYNAGKIKKAKILDDVSFFHQNVLNVESFTGGLVLTDKDSRSEQRVKSAEGLIMTYSLKSVDGPSYDFQRAWYLGIAAQVDPAVVEIAYVNNRAFDDESNRLVIGDLPIFFLGMMIILVYLVLTLGPITSADRSRVLLGFFVFLNLVLALAAGFGIAAAAGTPFPPIVPLLPLIVLGVQLDGVIIMVDFLNHEDPAGDLPTRLGAAFSEAGPAILLTTCTTVVAFAVGSQVDLPAVTSFCIYAACAFTVSMFSTFTFFLSVLVLDERRLIAGRVSFFPCVRAAGCPSCPCSLHDPTDPAITKGPSMDKPAHERHGPIQRFVRDTYAPTLLKPPVAATVVAVFVILGALSAAGAPFLDLGLDNADVVPDDSFLKTTFEFEQTTFGGSRIGADIVVRNASFSDRRTMELIRDSIAEMRRQDYVVVVPRQSVWHAQYSDWLKSNGKDDDLGRKEYTDKLGTFLDKDRFARFREQVACEDPPPLTRNVDSLDDDDCKDPVAVRYFITIKRPISNEGLDAIARRNELEAMLTRRGLDGFIHSVIFLTDEFDTVIWEVVLSNMGFACLSIFVIVIFFTPPVVAAWITVCVASIYVDLFGVLYMLRIPLNGVSFTCLVMSVGLSVDYCVHLSHAFDVYHDQAEKDMAAGGEPADTKVAVVKALTKMGVSVLKGGWTTILGIFIIAFSSSNAFRVFFQCLVFTVILGALHGLVLMPVLLAYASQPLTTLGLRRPASSPKSAEPTKSTANKV
eukprot:CAMPEP_0206036456 /NCGR_PEP_ID=MMETSP1466-20131121/2767_1 /ASSEMBLY_ACC=CAM_ASM_001126 /TAXON_ID=44452 /ORGANISM="Pavlova gyrans, Strain CCMP608" /LENGTH=898 /DNA_ID=CAMNT_0053410931 /DNA_START=64 /DNA_END=2760 /DNA_ORIENTATION=-